MWDYGVDKCARSVCIKVEVSAPPHVGGVGLIQRGQLSVSTAALES